MSNHIDKVSAAGLLIAFGIIYGDTGNSPLNSINSHINGCLPDQALITGSLSFIFWTLTLQATIHYAVLILRAGHHGDRGIFALDAIVISQRRLISTIAGAAVLLAACIFILPFSGSISIVGATLITVLFVPTLGCIILTFLKLKQKPAAVFSPDRAGDPGIADRTGYISEHIIPNGYTRVVDRPRSWEQQKLLFVLWNLANGIEKIKQMYTWDCFKSPERNKVVVAFRKIVWKFTFPGMVNRCFQSG